MGTETQLTSRTYRELAVGSLLLATLLTSSFSARASDLLDVALSCFPSETLRLEFVSLEKLRRQPDYESLHQRYVGPRLEVLGKTFAKLGLHEDGIDEIVMAWLPGTKEKGFVGLATGRFSSAPVPDEAAALGFTLATDEGQNLVCQETEWAEVCIVLLDGSLGAFGTRTSLRQMLRVRAGRGTRLTENLRFMRLVEEGQARASIWGVAVKPEVIDWFTGWLEGRGVGQIDWSMLVQDVDALAYRVDAGDVIQLQVKMDCSTTEAADRLRNVLELLKVLLPLAWQSQNPGLSNPVRNMAVSLNGTRITVELNADPQGLRAVEQTFR